MTDKSKSDLILIAFLVPFIVAFLVIFYLIVSGYFTRLIYLNENIALTKQFNLHYKGRDFDSLKMSCDTNGDVSITFEVAEQIYHLDDYSKFCLYQPGSYERFASYLEIVRNPGDQLSFKVLTTGEEMKNHYTSELVEKLMTIVSRSYWSVDADNLKKQSWLKAS